MGLVEHLLTMADGGGGVTTTTSLFTSINTHPTLILWGVTLIWFGQECVPRALKPFPFLRGGPGSNLPKFKFSVEFPIGLHVILQLQIKKFKTA